MGLRRSDVITGFLTYVAVFGMTAIWILGWSGISIVVGSFFDLPLRTIALVGATLGPLGFIVTLAVGVLETRNNSNSYLPVVHQGEENSSHDPEDPFS